MKTRGHLNAIVVALLLAVFAAPAALRAQDPDELMPAASAAKAKAILDQAIAALGGPAYLNERDFDCKGRYGQFDSASGEAGPSLAARFMRLLPDKSRTEIDLKVTLTDIYYFPINTKGRIMMVYTPDGAWALSKEGVADMGTQAVSDYKDQLRTDMNTLLRSRLDEDGLLWRYGGGDVVDLNQVDWVEVTDREQHTMRIAVDAKTRLPVRFTVTTRDPATNKRTETTRTYSNYHSVGGVEIPFQTAAFTNDRPSSQTFYDSCQLNVGLSPDLFTQSGLDAEYARIGKKSK